MSKYTDQDVRVLVSQVEIFIKEYDKNYAIRPQFERDCVEQALTPFRPDPEEELIEAMVIVHQNTIATMNPDAIWTWDECNERAKTEVQAGIRAALAVIKEKGYFNDQR